MLDPEILERFSCSGCGACCRWGGSVLLTEEDIRDLAAHLGLAEQAFIDAHTRLAPDRRRLALLDQDDGACAFLAGDACSVYAARPAQCRNFPHTWHVRSGCPELDRLTAEKRVEEARSKA